MRICLLCSGNLGYQILCHLESTGRTPDFIMTDSQSEEIIEFAIAKKIDFYKGNPRKKEAKDFIHKINCDIILSVNYLFIIEADLIQRARHFAINIHGSLLPKYRGRTPHVWSIINNEKETGVTAHLIVSEVDAGAICHQEIINIDNHETGADILIKFQRVYKEVVDKLMDKIDTNSLTLTEQIEEHATYFGERTPKDGLIDFNWCKERIFNWIRAQASPYPGAFFYHKKQIIPVHASSFSKIGFHQNDYNGKILKIEDDGIHIKTPNGALKLHKIEESLETKFSLEDKLNDNYED